MNPNLLLTAALALASFTGLAQTTPAPTPAQLTREMSERLQLNEGQYVRLLAVNRTKLTRQHEIEQATQNNPTARTTQLAELQGQYERECSRILSPTQLSQLQQESGRPAEIANGNG